MGLWSDEELSGYLLGHEVTSLNRKNTEEEAVFI
jgi:hypothetical protein